MWRASRYSRGRRRFCTAGSSRAVWSISLPSNRWRRLIIHLNQQFGSYDLFRTSIDATGPLTKDDTLLYRFNGSFQSNNSFRDLVSGEDVFLAPILKWNISPRTQATLEMEYQHHYPAQITQVLPFVITIAKNTLSISRTSRNLGEANPTETEKYFVGFNWSHQFNDDWSIKHQVTFKRQNLTKVPSYYLSLLLATITVIRICFE